MAELLSPGVTTILSVTDGSTNKVGAWYRIQPHLSRLSWQGVLTASTVGATLSCTAYIEVSNDGVNALATKGQTLALSVTNSSQVVSDGAVLASSMAGAWQYIRANLSTMTTATAGSTGVPQFAVLMSAGYQSGQ